MDSVMVSWLVLPSSPKGNDRRIELAGLDLWIVPRIDNVFVYPAEVDINRFKEALSQTLSLWPLVTGRFLPLEDGRYFIGIIDAGIPVTYTENTELEKWPHNKNIVVEIAENPLIHFIDAVHTIKLLHCPAEEPLVRLSLTWIRQSGEWVLGSSWAHILGDAQSNLNFLHTLSLLYQQLEPPKPSPIFERRMCREEEADLILVPFMKELNNAKPSQEAFAAFLNDDRTHEHLNLHFTGKLNIHCFNNKDKYRILRTNTAINFRGVSDSIAPAGLSSNAVLVVSSDDFDDPFSLPNIAQIIRQSVVRTRDPKFLEPCVATADRLLRDMAREDMLPYLGPYPNDITVNSNLRYDWAALVDFGYTDRCRFHTVWTGRLYFRVFRLNPTKYGSAWLVRDRYGAEVTFRISKDIKEKFLSTLEKDLAENFSNV